MLGWVTIESRNFKSVKLRCQYGRVTAYAEDFDGVKTHAYIITLLNEASTEVVYTKPYVAENFEFFSSNERNELLDILRNKVESFCKWEYSQIPE